MLDFKLRKAFGVRLRALRKQHNWTLKELAAKLDFLPTQLNKYECGENLPPGEKLVEIAALFHTSIDFLLAGTAPSDLPLHNKRLLDRFLALQQFPAQDQEIIISLIDAFIVKLQVHGALHLFDQPAHSSPTLPIAPIANSAASAGTAAVSPEKQALPVSSSVNSPNRSRRSSQSKSSPHKRKKSA